MRQPYTLYRRTLRSGKKVWYYACWDGNQRVYRSTGCTTKAVALAVIKKRIEEGTLISEGRSTYLITLMEEMYTEGSEYMKDRQRIDGELKENTLIFYRGSVNRLRPYLGKKKLENVSQRELEKLQQDMKKDGFSPATINASIAAISTVYKWAMRLGMTRNNPCALLPMMKNRGRKPEVWTEQEVAQLTTLDFWNGNVLPYLASLLCAYTGVRISEALGLQWDDIRAGKIHVQRSISRSGSVTDTKNHKDRYVSVPSFVVEELKKYRVSPLWVLSADGRTPVKYLNLMNMMGRYRKKIDPACEKSWHSFRHFLNTEVASSGVPETMVRAVIGHSSKEMTDRYYHGETADLSPIEQVQDRIEKTLANEQTRVNNHKRR